MNPEPPTDGFSFLGQVQCQTLHFHDMSIEPTGTRWVELRYINDTFQPVNGLHHITTSETFTRERILRWIPLLYLDHYEH